MLPKAYQSRKALPLYTFLTEYFPDAFLELVKVSVAGNVQHNPGEPMHWARGKSMDQLNTAQRHLFDHGTGTVYDTETLEVLQAIYPDAQPEALQALSDAGAIGTMHLAKAAWRILAEIQLLCESRDDIANHVAEVEAAGTANPEIELTPAEEDPAPTVPPVLTLACGCVKRCKGHPPICPAYNPSKYVADHCDTCGRGRWTHAAQAQSSYAVERAPTGFGEVPGGTGPRDPLGRPYRQVEDLPASGPDPKVIAGD